MEKNLKENMYVCVCGYIYIYICVCVELNHFAVQELIRL